MIGDRNRIYDGWFSLEGGVDAGRAPELINLNQCQSSENMSFRGGKPTTRPGFRLLPECFPPIGNHPNVQQTFCYHIAVGGFGGMPYHPIGEYVKTNDVVPGDPKFHNENSEYIYRNGVFQGAMAFTPHNQSADSIMAMIGGRLFRIIPGTQMLFPDNPQCSQATVPTKVTEIPVDDKQHPYMRNNQFKTLAYMVQADKFLLVQDGESRCIIYDGATARRANLSTTRDNIEIPVGTIMAYGMGRVCVVVNERDIAFGDLYGSHLDKQTDPADSIILFTERTFLSGGFDAAIPFQQGVVTGMAFFPQLDTSTGNGQLLAFAERGAAAFFLSLDRSLWQTSQFQILALLTTGLRGHRSISVVNEDLWFRANDGVRSYRQARSEPTGWAHIPLSTNVGQFFDFDSDWMLKYVSSIYFDNRVLITTSPAPNQGKPFNSGLCVVDFDNLSSFGVETSSRPAWEGHWTFPGEVKILQVLTGVFSNVTRAFAFCLAPAEDGTLQNQLFELSIDDKDDWLDQRIQWELVSRALDFQKFSQQSTAFNEVEIYDGDIWLSEIIE